MSIMSVRLPQLRVLVTDYCNSRCVYCRPSGEGNLGSRHMDMKYVTAINVARAYSSCGGSCMKITGGDPVFWPHSVEFVHALKGELAFEHVELITRSPAISKIIGSLADSSLDVLNFSLDTLSPIRYHEITGRNDFDEYISTITRSALLVSCKINMVILQDTSVDEVTDMMTFCMDCGIRELKLLDYIEDLNEGCKFCKGSQSSVFQSIYKKLDALSSNRTRVFQGDFGHPMNDFKITENFHVICKDSSLGAWYVPHCLKCGHYPCHDAVMALRVTPYDTFQFCLVNEKMQWSFTESNVDEQLNAILSVYERAFLVKDSD